MTERQKKFLEFVILYHGSQIRKYTHEPYWHHCLEVADMVSEHDKTPLLWEVGLGHDLLEDTTCTSNLLYTTLLKFEYSQREAGLITGGVISLTDVYTKERFPALNRVSRKQKEAQRLGKIKPEFQSVKYADLISNTKSISEHDPGFAKVYLKEKRELLNEIRDGDIDLLIKCCSIRQRMAQIAYEKVYQHCVRYRKSFDELYNQVKVGSNENLPKWVRKWLLEQDNGVMDENI